MVQGLRLDSRAVVGVEDVAYLVFGVFGKLVEGAVARTMVMALSLIAAGEKR